MYYVRTWVHESYHIPTCSTVGWRCTLGNPIYSTDRSVGASRTDRPTDRRQNRGRSQTLFKSLIEPNASPAQSTSIIYWPLLGLCRSKNDNRRPTCKYVCTLCLSKHTQFDPIPTCFFTVGRGYYLVVVCLSLDILYVILCDKVRHNHWHYHPESSRHSSS